MRALRRAGRRSEPVLTEVPEPVAGPGHATLEIAAKSITPGGHITLVGLNGGTLPVSLLGLPYGVSVTPTYWGTRPEQHDVLRLAARGDLRAHVRTWPLSHATEAYAAVAAGTVRGRAVVVPD